MAGNESAVGQLYHIYGTLFPEKQDFWYELEKEENKHAQWLTKLGNKLVTRQIYFDQNRFKIEAVRLFPEILKKKMEQAKHTKITLSQALGNATNIESALLEKEFFTIFEHDSVEIKHLLMELSKETAWHRAKIQSQISQLP